jgi:hypothetical protein
MPGNPLPAVLRCHSNIVQFKRWGENDPTPISYQIFAIEGAQKKIIPMIQQAMKDGGAPGRSIDALFQKNKGGEMLPGNGTKRITGPKGMEVKGLDKECLPR